MDSNRPLFTLTVDEAKCLIKEWIKECIEETKTEPPKTLPEYYTREETCKILKISLPTLDRYTELRLIKTHRIGNRKLYSTDAIQEALINPMKYIRVPKQ